MMLIKPSLRVERLIAKENAATVYDELFHTGINVLSGSNSCGKTSIVQLLVYGLGYEVKNWKVEAGRCTRVYIGVNINGTSITLKRDNAQTEKQALSICFEKIEDALNAPIEMWSVYPYAISQNKESFSQKLFSLLELPEARSGNSNNNITLHQILRLIYSDQSNPAFSLFNVEQFDSAFNRESVGNYLLGLHDNDIYNAKVELTSKTKELDKAISELRAVYAIIGKTSYAEKMGTIEEEKVKYLSEIEKINDNILEIKKNSTLSYVDEKNTTENHAALSIKLKGKLLECETDIQHLSYDVEDSKEFISELEDKFSSIKDSIKVQEVFQTSVFSSCPSCHSKLPARNANQCKLCGVEHEESMIKTNILRMKNELEIQIKESKKIIARKINRKDKLILKRKSIRSELRKNISRMTFTVASIDSSSESSVYELYRKIGEIEEKIENLENIQELHNSIQSLTSQKNELQAKVNELKEFLNKKKFQYGLRDKEIKNLIQELLVGILREDIGAEKEFSDAEIIDFDFASNRLSVNGKSYFSESGQVYLNNAFHFSLFLCSLLKGYVRIPRFIILDGIENGGMEDIRSKNFQRIIKEKVEEHQIDCQVIFATKSISDTVSNSNYIVGRHFTKESKSLDM